MHIQPPIWRRIAVPGTVTLAKLHNIIQISMGSDNYHIYLFDIDKQSYGEGTQEWAEFDQRVINAKRVMLQDIASRKRASFLYTYDMGDGWEHEVLVEQIEEGVATKILCLDGARHCPPEDCGGPHGHEGLLDIIFDPRHPEFEERKEWLGGRFDPEYFNPEPANRRLNRLKVRTEAA